MWPIKRVFGSNVKALNEQHNNDHHNAAMRSVSGDFRSDSMLTSFIYELCRDHLPVGKVEAIVRHVLDERVEYDRTKIFCNGWLAQYAADVGKRLNGH